VRKFKYAEIKNQVCLTIPQEDAMQDQERTQFTYTDKCPLRYALDKIGGKWKIPILWELNINNTMRFNQLKKEIHGITNAMLSTNLQELIHDGIVERVQYNEMPVRVEYFLTDAGKELFPILSQLSEWGEQQQASTTATLNCIK
jgi:DNA-binding HxlR family transcriptional regulator